MLTVPEVLDRLISAELTVSPNSDSRFNITSCGLLILDDFDNQKHLELLEKVEQLCDNYDVNKPHILGKQRKVLSLSRS